MTSELDYKAINERVDAAFVQEKSRTRTIFFIVSLIFYIVFFILGFVIFKKDNVFAMFIMAFGGFMGLIFHGLSVSLDTKRWEEMTRERLMAQEIPREMLKMAMNAANVPDKQKGMMRLTDDGELEEVFDDTADLSEETPLKRQR